MQAGKRFPKHILHSWSQYWGRFVSREIYKAAFSGLPALDLTLPLLVSAGLRGKQGVGLCILSSK